jgi:NitT/TauT family transport system ATP-binding protein
MLKKPALSLKSIDKCFSERPGHRTVALEDISLQIVPGEFFVIIGPSGSGKSTLLRIMSGLDVATNGRITWGQGSAEPEMAFVFQEFALIPWLTVFQNVEMGLLKKNLTENKRHNIVHRELEQFGLTKFAQAFPRELSGGMRQRVGIARALAVEPKIMFMDEPFSELDSFTARMLRQELLQIWQEKKITIVMVTHLMQDAIELADRIAVMTPRPGRIEKIVENHLRRPRNRRSREAYRLEDMLDQLVKP